MVLLFNRTSVIQKQLLEKIQAFNTNLAINHSSKIHTVYPYNSYISLYDTDYHIKLTSTCLVL